ncbi:T. brucei spp.-specific protein [Trypanosoma brucei gambiense DAL972]|uniref:Uncharacterized protein n=1 Tax=Trypanosoma brucei gambiense (strain MHOM/CI/86/DAL972) TaxID=679716 RepID=C9ZLF1_TRYB9|nr:T. brucei spp.-specific protein [Trypanosoma brucei gambiense DAL972]CBH10160.1 T. brucei spp.-specific protein [Trypanosoma brucei gambiense DAL972]|eukprot:XP_011772450.1 T. brucei spp.-specific protein [Trypanosoma brucei gambiense DAL972]
MEPYRVGEVLKTREPLETIPPIRPFIHQSKHKHAHVCTCKHIAIYSTPLHNQYTKLTDPKRVNKKRKKEREKEGSERKRERGKRRGMTVRCFTFISTGPATAHNFSFPLVHTLCYFSAGSSPKEGVSALAHKEHVHIQALILFGHAALKHNC